MTAAASFRDLEVWREAHKLVLLVYQATESFPVSEQFGLKSQMRRAAVSVPANIVEGFKRHGWQEKLRFYNIAEASLEELKYFLLRAHDLVYIRDIGPLEAQADVVGRLLFRFREGAAKSLGRATPPNS
jgi:four helix bundle protein